MQKQVNAVALVLCATLGSVTARAADDAHLEALGTFGFTEHITTQVQAYGVGTGLRVGYTLPQPFMIAGGITRHAGARASGASAGPGPGAIYSSRSSAWSADAFAAWDWRPAACLSVRLGLVLNAALVFRRTQVLGALAEDTYLQGSLGPKLSVALFPTRGFILGVEGEARSIPTRFYAPLGSVAAFWGARF
jgi:hypothetical protein